MAAAAAAAGAAGRGDPGAVQAAAQTVGRFRDRFDYKSLVGKQLIHMGGEQDHGLSLGPRHAPAMIYFPDPKGKVYAHHVDDPDQEQFIKSLITATLFDAQQFANDYNAVTHDDKFGTSGRQVSHWIEKMGKKNYLGTYTSDTLPCLKYVKPGSFLVATYTNYQDVVDGKGSRIGHWVAMGNLNSPHAPPWYFDSSGTPPGLLSFNISKLKKGVTPAPFAWYLDYFSKVAGFGGAVNYNQVNLQPNGLTSDTCGNWSAYAVLYGLPINDGKISKKWARFIGKNAWVNNEVILQLVKLKVEDHLPQHRREMGNAEALVATRQLHPRFYSQNHFNAALYAPLRGFAEEDHPFAVLDSIWEEDPGKTWIQQLASHHILRGTHFTQLEKKRAKRNPIEIED